MKLAVLSLALCAIALAQPEAAPVKVSKLSTPQRSLKFEVLVPAKAADVWTAFTTSEGLKTWLWKDCTVDLRPGGGWTVNFPGGSTGGGTIVSFDAGRQIMIRALAPEKFPEVRHTGTAANFEFASEGDKTRVTLTQTGWKEGKEWDDAYEYLAQGNAQLLGQLYLRFKNGPLRWQ
jgi:uncharacterized protein YndB with AHSA1/START domain